MPPPSRHLEPLFSVGEVGRLNPYHGEDLPLRFTHWFHGPPPGGGASRRWEDFRLCVTARPRVGVVAPLGEFSVMCHGPPPDGGASRRRAMTSWWSSSWPTPFGGTVGPVVLVCVVVRKGCVSVLTGRVIFGELLFLGETSLGRFLLFLHFFTRATRRHSAFRHLVRTRVSVCATDSPQNACETSPTRL